MFLAIMKAVTKMLVALANKGFVGNDDGTASASQHQHVPHIVSVFLAVAIVFLATAVCLSVATHL